MRVWERNKAMIQIQPVFNKRTEFEVLAERRGLLFEALELSFDGVSEEKAEWYRTSGKVHSLHGAFIDVNPGSGDGEIAALSEKRYVESCEKAIACGAKNVVFHSTCFPFLRGYYIESWLKKMADFYIRLAGQYPELRFFTENSFDIDPEPLKRLMELVKAPNMGICLDIGHINYSRVPLEGWFDALGEYTGYLHLSDNMGVYDDHMTLGTGTVDWEKASKLSSALKKDTPVTLEISSPENIAASLDYLSENGYFGGVL